MWNYVILLTLIWLNVYFGTDNHNLASAALAFSVFIYFLGKDRL